MPPRPDFADHTPTTLGDPMGERFVQRGATGSSASLAAGEPSLTRLRQVEMILQSVDTLPTLSPIAARAVRLSSASEEGFDELIALIELDPVLASRIVSLCRRSNLGVARSVSTVRRAAVMLGWHAVQAAVLSVHIYELMRQHPGAGAGGARASATGEIRGDQSAFDAPGFWRRAIGVGSAAEGLAAAHPALKIAPEEAFLAGLVSTLGTLALDWILPQTYDKVLHYAEARRVSLAAAERQLIGLDHHQAGKRLGERWSLPLSLQDAMWLHAQTPAALPEVGHSGLIGLVCVATEIVHRLHIGQCVGTVDQRPAALWRDKLALIPAQCAEVESRVHEQVSERCRVLGIGEVTGQQLMIESLTAANRRLAALEATTRSAARTAGDQQRVLASIGTFAAGERPGGTVVDALARVAEGWRAVTGRAPAAIICQARHNASMTADHAGPGEDWRVVRFDESGAIVDVRIAPALIGADGHAMDLGHLAGSEALADAARLLRWVQEHIDRAELAGHASPGSHAPLLSHSPHGPNGFGERHAVHPLISALGPAAAVVYDPTRPLPGTTAMHTLGAFWAWAIGAAVQGEGVRRLGERLASSARELAEAQELLAEHQSMARLGEFTNGAAHELNNPLTVISGRAQVIAERLKGQKGEDDARAIVRAAESMTDLITQLHMVSRPPSVRPELVSLEAWAQQSVSDARRRCGLSLPVEVTIAGDATATIDAVGAGKALMEVVINALQATPRSCVRVRIEPGPTVPIVATSGASSSATAATATKPGTSQTILIEVIDDGIGMSEHTRRHAFDPFFSDMPAGRRPGLGLPLVKRLIEAQGGTVELGSSPGKGTTVRMTIPIIKAAEARTDRRAA
jgi:signal transduction histidine kinase/HD-like signal output (HDOD) protein